MKKVTDPSFRPYGRVFDLDVSEFVKTIGTNAVVSSGTVYEPSVAAFEALPLFAQLRDEVYGGLPVEFGHCSGFNTKLNAVEYHRSSEIDIAATDMYLMLGKQQDIDYTTNEYKTDNMEIFYVPAGTAVELYATTLHFAPCSVDGKEFRCGVVLPKGTNEPLQTVPPKKGENALLFAANKWLIAHKDSGLQNDGAVIGLVGKNLEI
ncbi:MAG: DUF4867 family protein [Megasphaera sp.]|jgi:hypothetical protein|nr:DUF4867 family protein [Megasphaera sp.]MCH4188383.1 DUF4867 family protein [Megasphaera sp.]MCH4218222.1 DUF4867 family protein [Megasphaera sp.]